MSSRQPGRGYTVRRVSARRVAETQLSFGDAGPESTAMTVSQLVARDERHAPKGGIPDVWVRGEIADLERPRLGASLFFFEG